MHSTLAPPPAASDASLDLQPHVDEFLERGFTVIPNVLTPEQVELGKQLLTDLFEREKTVAQKHGWRNATYQCCYMLPGKHEFFRKLPLNPRTLGFVRKILGDDCILSSLNGLTMAPGGPNQVLHLDQPEHTPGIVININATHTLDDFTRENGATRIVPASHLRSGRNRDFAGEEGHTIQIEAPAGSLIAFNGGAILAGSANRTDKLRRCLHAYYTRAWAKPQWDFKRSLPSEIVAQMNDDEKRLYGFQSMEQVYDLNTNEVRRYG